MAEEAGAKGDPPVLAAKKQLQAQAMGRHPAEREEFREIVEFWRKNSTVLAKERESFQE
ncbi:hypothetical protein VE00_10728 [Pseudogymnoascus sp. WSF 3629]|nr:hypothetical protein VE00_10728 [Pseudogymnoascus sp. WSF 3629]